VRGRGRTKGASGSKRSSQCMSQQQRRGSALAGHRSTVVRLTNTLNGLVGTALAPACLPPHLGCCAEFERGHLPHGRSRAPVAARVIVRGGCTSTVSLALDGEVSVPARGRRDCLALPVPSFCPWMRLVSLDGPTCPCSLKSSWRLQTYQAVTFSSRTVCSCAAFLRAWAAALPLSAIVCTSEPFRLRGRGRRDSEVDEPAAQLRCGCQPTCISSRFAPMSFCLHVYGCVVCCFSRGARIW
jgi:hypothetical protein